jgi:DNA-binding NarL/FixJ family response regulator
MLSMHKSEDFLSMSLEAGARGYLLKEDSGDELLQAIDQIRKGKTYLSKKLASDFPRPSFPSVRAIFQPLQTRSPPGNARCCK